MSDLQGWQWLVRRLCSPTALQPDVRRLAGRCGLKLMAGEGGSAYLFGVQLYYDASAPWYVQEAQIARTVTRHALRRTGIAETPEAVRYVSEAVLTWIDAARTAAARKSSSGVYDIEVGSVYADPLPMTLVAVGAADAHQDLAAAADRLDRADGLDPHAPAGAGDDRVPGELQTHGEHDRAEHRLHRRTPLATFACVAALEVFAAVTASAAVLV